MGLFEWLGISPRDAPKLPSLENNLRDSGQTFVFGRADSGERVDEKSAMQIATVYACVRLLAESVAGLPLHLYRMRNGTNAKERATEHIIYVAGSVVAVENYVPRKAWRGLYEKLPIFVTSFLIWN